MDPRDFEPKRGDPSHLNKAIQTCFTCPVRAECKDYQERTQSEYGVWGGEIISRKKGNVNPRRGTHPTENKE